MSSSIEFISSRQLKRHCGRGFGQNRSVCPLSRVAFLPHVFLIWFSLFPLLALAVNTTLQVFYGEGSPGIEDGTLGCIPWAVLWRAYLRKKSKKAPVSVFIWIPSLHKLPSRIFFSLLLCSRVSFSSKKMKKPGFFSQQEICLAVMKNKLSSCSSVLSSDCNNSSHKTCRTDIFCSHFFL